MKRFMTAVALGALLAGAATAAANDIRELKQSGLWSEDSIWDGGSPDSSTEDAFFTHNAVTGLTVTVDETSTAYADTFATTSAAVEFLNNKTLTTDSIDVDSASRAVTLAVSKTGIGSGTRLWDSAGNVDIDASVAADGTYDAQMTINLGVEVEVGSSSSGDVRLFARPASYAADAILEINGGELDPQHDMFLCGGNPDATHGQAKLVLESAGTLRAPTNLVMQGDSRFEAHQAHGLSVTDLHIEPDTINDYRTEAVVQVVTSGDNVTVGDITIGGDAYASRLEKTGSGELTGSTLTVTAPNDVAADAKFLLSAGTTDIDDVVQLNSDSTYAAQAIIEVSNDTTFEPNSIDANGGDSAGEEAELIFNESVTVQNVSSPFTSFDGRCTVTLGVNTTFNAKAVTLEDADVDLHVTGSHLTTSKFQCTSLTYSNAADVTFSGPLTVEGITS
jgi:hypothetical protein